MMTGPNNTANTSSRKIRAVVLFNGTSNDDKDIAVTNVVKLRDALVEDDKQFVIYRDGIGNDQEWNSWTRYFALATGYGGGWVMKEAYQQLKQQINRRIQEKQLLPEDTLVVSTGGFSRGAALARYFGKEYILKRLAKDYHGKFNIKLAEEYLYDTVGAFGIPINLWLLEKLGIRNQEIDPGWDFSIPENTKGYHAIAIGEQREAYTPKHMELHANAERLEVYFSGDHSTVGGGHTKPQGTDKLADTLSLHFMAKMMLRNGLRLNERFIEKHNLKDPDKKYHLGHIFKTKKESYPSTQIEDRKIHALIEGKLHRLKRPILHWSVLERIKQDKHYRPNNLRHINEAKVLFENNTIKKQSMPNFNKIK